MDWDGYDRDTAINWDTATLSIGTAIADITNYYNFSGINDVTVNTDNYIDSSHYNAYVGDMMIDVMVNDFVDESLHNQGLGWYVTSENVNDLLNILQKNAIVGKTDTSVCRGKSFQDYKDTGKEENDG